jgi:hypothetical protein
MIRRPPRLTSLLLRLRFSQKTCEFLLGDLVEELNTGKRSSSWYWQQVRSLLCSRLADQDADSERISATNVLQSIWSDLRTAKRVLASSRGTTIGAVLALALGIGGSSFLIAQRNPAEPEHECRMPQGR